MIDVSQTTAPKSDQLNADDLVGGPIDITITDVRLVGSSNNQPFNVSYEGDNGRPYKPCKIMRRVLIALWGKDGTNYIGRSLRLYCDPEVKYSGQKVGGIRISHASHITEVVPVLLTMSRSKRSQFIVHPMEANSAPQTSGRNDVPPVDLELDDVDAIALVAAAESAASGGQDIYRDWFTGQGKQQRLYLTKTIEPDPNDFNKEKSIHDRCKGISDRSDTDATY